MQVCRIATPSPIPSPSSHPSLTHPLPFPPSMHFPCHRASPRPHPAPRHPLGMSFFLRPPSLSSLSSLPSLPSLPSAIAVVVWGEVGRGTRWSRVGRSRGRTCHYVSALATCGVSALCGADLQLEALWASLWSSLQRLVGQLPTVRGKGGGCGRGGGSWGAAMRTTRVIAVPS